MRPGLVLALASLAPLTTACHAHPGGHDAGAADPGGGLVTVDASGPGRVTSTPAGIDCGGRGTACSHRFTARRVVLATDPETTVRWSGDCAGNGARNGDCTLAVDGDRAVTATTFAPLRRTFDGDDHGLDECWAIAASSGDSIGGGSIGGDSIGGDSIGGDSIVVTGEIQRIAQGYDAWTRAYDAGGAVLWTHELSTPSEGEDRGSDVIATPGGGAIVAGMWYSGSSTRRNSFVAAIDQAGAPVWVRESEVLGDDVYLGVARDGAGALIVAGSRPDAHGGSQAWLRKLGAAGEAEAWAVTRDGSLPGGADAAHKVAVDPADHVIAVGYETHAGTGRDGWIARFDPAGAPIWSIPIAGPGDGADEIVDVAAGSDGSIAVVGQLGASSTVRILAADGSPRWDATDAGTAAWRAVAIDPAGNVLAAGSAGADLIVRKYAPGGALVWQRSFADAAGNGVAADRQGNVLVCGAQRTAGGKTDLLMLKLYQ